MFNCFSNPKSPFLQTKPQSGLSQQHLRPWYNFCLRVWWLWRGTMTTATPTKENISLGLSYSFRGLVHCPGGKHSNMQADTARDRAERYWGWRKDEENQLWGYCLSRLTIAKVIFSIFPLLTHFQLFVRIVPFLADLLIFFPFHLISFPEPYLKEIPWPHLPCL